MKVKGYMGFLTSNALYKRYTTRLPKNSHFCAEGKYIKQGKCSTTATFYHTCMDYCGTIEGHANLTQRIYKLQRHASRIITVCEYRASSDPLLKQLN